MDKTIRDHSVYVSDNGCWACKFSVDGKEFDLSAFSTWLSDGDDGEEYEYCCANGRREPCVSAEKASRLFAEKGVEISPEDAYQILIEVCEALYVGPCGDCE